MYLSSTSILNITSKGSCFFNIQYTLYTYPIQFEITKLNIDICNHADWAVINSVAREIRDKHLSSYYKKFKIINV